MKVFILEDDPLRMVWFRRRFIGHEVTHAESCTQADQFVGPYDLVLLDHDLGGRGYGEEHDDCGLTFVHLVKDRLGEATVVIHSLNGPAAQQMYWALNEMAYYRPFRGPEFVRLLDSIEQQYAGL